MVSKFQDPESFRPRLVEDDPYADLFAGLTAEEAIELQKEIDDIES